MLVKIFTISLIIFFTSCSSSKNTKQETDNNALFNQQSNIEVDKQMEDEGYQIGTVQYLKNSKCEYIIIDVKTKAKFDPINISEETYNEFRKDAQKVYYKYRGLRMMNRCPEANPIQILEIKKREG